MFLPRVLAFLGRAESFIHDVTGENMSDTIELLESIGRDALLRRASRETLTQALDGMGAGEGLKMAAASGDRSHLAQELGGDDNKTVQVTNMNQGGCDPGDDDTDGEPDQGGEGEEKSGSRDRNT